MTLLLTKRTVIRCNFITTYSTILLGRYVNNSKEYLLCEEDR